MPGLYFEEFEPGAVIEHATRRTVTEMDNVLFSHADAEPAAAAPRRRVTRKDSECTASRLVNSLFIARAGDRDHGRRTPRRAPRWATSACEEVKFPKPVFHGDTIRVRTEIMSKRESKSRDDSGIVFFRHYGINQRDEIVCDAQRAGLMLKRPEKSEEKLDDQHR